MTVEQAIRILREEGHEVEEQTIFLWNQKAYRVDGVYRFADWIIREVEKRMAAAN